MENHDGLRNAAYSDAYIQQCAKYDILFSERNKGASDTINLPEGYSILKTSYKGQFGGCNIHANRCTLYDENGNNTHTWKSYDDDADFEILINHQAGNKYFIYRQELYGYSVFDLTNNKAFQYLPQCVLDNREYFIWTDVHYNPLNNIAAISGCIWACPWSTLLVDFSEPMSEPKFQLDVINCLDKGYDIYDDADFVKWDGDALVLNCFERETKSMKEVIISSAEYNKWIYQE